MSYEKREAVGSAQRAQHTEKTFVRRLRSRAPADLRVEAVVVSLRPHAIGLREVGQQARADAGKYAKDDVDAYVESSKAGVGLVFELTDDAKPSLALNDVQFMAGLASQGCDRFGGKLPEGLSFDDTRDVVRSKLGPPSEASEEPRIDTWDRIGYQLVIEYRKEFAGIRLLHLSGPDTPIAT